MDLDERFRNVSESMTLVRGRGAFGRKPNRARLMEAAAYGPVTTHHYDDSTGTTTLATLQDLEPIFNANRDDRNSGHDGYTPSRDFRRVASIPNSIVMEWHSKGINMLRNEDWGKVVAMLDDPDYAHLRTDATRSRISKKATRKVFVPPNRRN